MMQFKKAIKERAELCNMEIKTMRKSKKYNNIVFVHGFNGEYAGLDLNDFLNGNKQWLLDLHKGFKKPLPKIVRVL
jgi:hypothetical protein